MAGAGHTPGSPLNKLSNGYAQALGPLLAGTPKAVLAAVAVSALTRGGERLDTAQVEVAREWVTLHQNGIVPQRPPKWVWDLAARHPDAASVEVR